MKIKEKIMFWLNASRLFSLPMTIAAWFVIFTYSLCFHEGNILNGYLALTGISFAHLAANLADDYFDYKAMLKDGNMMSTVVKNKCAYIKDGQASLNDVLKVIAIYCAISLLTGIILLFRCGLPVIWLALIGGILTLTYSKFSRVGLSELAVGIAFGPLLFEGVFYVMTKQFSWGVFVLSLAVGAFIVGVLYVHTILDFDSDMISHKKTLCCRIGNKDNALLLLYFLYFIGFAASVLFSLMVFDLFVLLSLFAIPFVFITCKALKQYIADNDFKPVVRWWNKPLDDFEKHKENGTDSFYFVLYQSRNLVIWFSLLLILGILL